MNERRVPAWRPKSFQETKLSEAEEEYIMKYVSVLQRKWEEEEEESNNETASDT